MNNNSILPKFFLIENTDSALYRPQPSTDSGFSYEEIIKQRERIAILEAREDRNSEFIEKIAKLETREIDITKDLDKLKNKYNDIENIKIKIDTIESSIEETKENKKYSLSTCLSILAIIMSLLSPLLTFWLGHSTEQVKPIIEKSDTTI